MPDAVTATQIDDAMSAYQVRLMVPTLKNGKLETWVQHTSAGGIQSPFVRSGQFARVFTVTDTNGVKRAVRCFYTAPRAEYQQRYSTIESFFRQHVGNITAGFRFHERGLKVGSGTKQAVMPIMEMEWVEGETLLACVDRLATKQDSSALKALAEGWLKLITEMRASGMAHGDLSGTNVMVRRGSGNLVLIDYDSVFLPAFAGRTTDQAGNPDYQHPDMQKRPYDGRMDNFSALLIYIALLALSERPVLWNSHIRRDSSGELVTETILFSSHDLLEPSKSALFRELAGIRTPEFQRLLSVLRDACAGPVDRVPDFLQVCDPLAEHKAAFAQLQDALKALDERRIVRAANASVLHNYPPAQDPRLQADIAQARKRVQQADELEALLVKDADLLALQLWARDGFMYTPIARAFVPRVQAVQQRLELMDQLRKAIDDQDDEAIVAAWDKNILGPYGPAQALLPAMMQAQARLERVKPLQAALQAGDDLSVERLWLELQNYPPAKKLEARVRIALDRIAVNRKSALQTLTKAVADGDDIEIVHAASHQLIDTGLLSKLLQARVSQARKYEVQANNLGKLLQAEDDSAALLLWEADGFAKSTFARALGPRVDVVRRRAEALRKLEQALRDTANLNQDRSIVAAWDESLFKGFSKAERHRKAYQLAQTALQQIKPLEEALQDKNDLAAIAAWEKVSKHKAAQSYRTSVEQASARVEKRRESAIKLLEQAIALGDHKRMVEAWDDPVLQGTEAIKVHAPRIEEAREQLAVVARLEKMLADPLQEEQALVIWQQQRLAYSPTGRSLKAFIERVGRRRKALEQVRRSVAHGDDAQLLSAWDERLFAGYQPAEAYLPQVELVKQRLRTPEALLTALGTGNDRLVMTLWDDVKVGELPEAARYEKDVRARKMRWLSTHMVSDLQGWLQEGQLTLTWNWPEDLSVAGITIYAEELTGTGRSSLDFGASSSKRPIREIASSMLSHTQYVRHGGYTRRVGQVQSLSVTVFPAIAHGKQWLTDAANQGARLHLRAMCTARYRLASDPAGKTYLYVDAEEVPALPTLLIVVSPNRPAANTATGNVIGSIGDLQRVPGTTGTYRTPISSKGWPSPSYVVLFPSNPQDRSWLDLVPEGGSPLKIA